MNGNDIQEDTHGQRAGVGAKAADACNGHRCSWEMDQEKADCYARLCKHLKDDQTCYKTKCRNDWAKPDPRSTANLGN